MVRLCFTVLNIYFHEIKFKIYHIYLLAIGGMDGSQYLNTVERYDPRVGIWEYVAPMSNRKDGAGAAVLDGNIYVSGGSNEITDLNIVEMFVFKLFYLC